MQHAPQNWLKMPHGSWLILDFSGANSTDLQWDLILLW